MFNDSQQLIYEACKDQIISRLELVVQKSQEFPSALNSALLMIKVSLSYTTDDVERLAKHIYPEREYKLIRDIFVRLSQLVRGKAANHPFNKYLSDPRLFTAISNQQGKETISITTQNGTETLSKPEYKKRLYQAFRSSLVEDITEWLNTTCQERKISMQTILELEQAYQQTILSSRANKPLQGWSGGCTIL